MGQRTRSYPRTSDLGEALALRIEVQDDGCWLWKSAAQPTGYGVFTWRGVTKSAHRWVWSVTVGDPPKGLELDHLCRVRGCCNPDHLELVTRAENMRRAKPFLRRGNDTRQGAKTHCPQGHAYDESNTRHHKGRRYCIACGIERAEHGVSRGPTLDGGDLWCMSWSSLSSSSRVGGIASPTDTAPRS